MSQLINTVKSVVKKIGRSSFSMYMQFTGMSLLSMEETKQLLAPYCIKTVPESVVDMPEILDENNPQQLLHKAHTFISGEVHVWQHSLKNGYISKHGSVVLHPQILCTDWDHRGIKHQFWKRDNRPAKTEDTVIALLSHPLQMNNPLALTGYYDFVLMVAAKLSRIKDTMSEEEREKAMITYHPFGGHYEKQYLELLGFHPENYIDSRRYKLSAHTVFFGDLGTWKPNRQEVLSLKKNIETRLHLSDETPATGNRIYISRKGSRVIDNEEEVVALLIKFDFTIIEDKERSVEEQIHIYRNASFIIGPHGASFANIIWCRPGTHLYELFSTSWSPDYFLYLAMINQMKYAAYKDDTHPDISTDVLNALKQDIYISLPKLQSSLEKIFG